MSNNIALELAKKILQSKLDRLLENGWVGDNHDVEIEYVARIEDDDEQRYQFKVVIWDEMEGRTVKTMGFAQLVAFVSRVCIIDWEKVSGKDWPIVPQHLVDQDIKDIDCP